MIEVAVILAAALASRTDDNDTIDPAVLDGLTDATALRAFKVTSFQSFDPVGKRTEATVTAAGQREIKVTKGAPQVILELAGNAATVKGEAYTAVESFAKRGFRALGAARSEGSGVRRFLGVVPLLDPPRKDAERTIATSREMGVKVKMVTGDALSIAEETAKSLGMGSNILGASGLGDSTHNESANAATA